MADDSPIIETITIKDVKLSYIVAGMGEPVVLIHGLHANSDLNWRVPGVFGALAKDHRVIAPDMPGHGRSDKPEGDEAYGVQMVEDVIQIMDQLKIEKAHIVGYSMGGMIGMKLVVTHPDRVRSVTMGGMGWLREGQRKQKAIDNMPARDGGRTPAACPRSFNKLSVTEDEIKAVKVPVTVIVGDRDPVKTTYLEPLRSVRKDWPIVEIADAGHINCVLKTHFRDEIVKWIEKNKGK
jgi:pimeloyl-ACP methyl ester carboxylesterase